MAQDEQHILRYSQNSDTAPALDDDVNTIHTNAPSESATATEFNYINGHGTVYMDPGHDSRTEIGSTVGQHDYKHSSGDLSHGNNGMGEKLSLNVNGLNGGGYHANSIYSPVALDSPLDHATPRDSFGSVAAPPYGRPPGAGPGKGPGGPPGGGPPGGMGGPPGGRPGGGPPMKDHAGEKMSKGLIALIMTALCMAVFLAALDVTIITTALPSIAADLQSASGYTWIGSAYLLGSAASTPIWGKLSDIFGRKPILLIANVVFFIGSLLAGVSVSMAMLIASRAVQGIGGGGLLTLVNISIGDLFSLRSRGAYYGIVGGTWALASAIGPLIGGAFTQKVTWRWCFYINLPLDGAAFIIICFFLKGLHKPSTALFSGVKAIDWVGSILIIGGTIMFLLGLEFGGIDYAWDSVIVLALLISGGVCIFLFCLNEWRLAPYPIIPLDIFSNVHSIACLVACFAHGFVFIGGSYYLPLYFQSTLGATPILSGVYTLATVLPLSFASVGTGIFIRKTGKYRPPIWFGFFFMTVGYGLYIMFGSTADWGKIIGFQIVAGLGTGPLFQAPLIALQSNIRPWDIAAATAAFQFVRNISTAISVVIGGVIFQNKMQSQRDFLSSALGPQLAQQLGGFSAGASTGLVDRLPEQQKQAAEQAFAYSLHFLWIMYVCFAGFGLLASAFIKRKELKKEHVQTKVGLEAEKEKRAEREEVRRIKRESKVTLASMRSQENGSRSSFNLSEMNSRWSLKNRMSSNGGNGSLHNGGGAANSPTNSNSNVHIPPMPNNMSQSRVSTWSIPESPVENSSNGYSASSTTTPMTTTNNNGSFGGPNTQNNRESLSHPHHSQVPLNAASRLREMV